MHGRHLCFVVNLLSGFFLVNRGKSLEKSWNKGPVFLVLPPSSQPHHSCVAPLLFPVAASVAIRKCITKISSQVVKLREEKSFGGISPPSRPPLLRVLASAVTLPLLPTATDQHFKQQGKYTIWYLLHITYVF